MSNGSMVTNFFAYPSRVVRLQEINVPTEYLRAPTTAQQSRVETQVSVTLVCDRIEPSQELRRSARNAPLFVFHEDHAENLRILTEARASNYHNIAGYLSRGGRQTLKGGGGGALAGAFAGGLLAFACPPFGMPVLLSAGVGAAGGAAAGAVVGVYDAWKNECATVRVIDYILNFNKMCQHFLAGQMSLEEAADQLLALYRVRREIGAAGEMLFDEAYDNIESSGAPQMQALTRAFLLLRGRD